MSRIENSDVVKLRLRNGTALPGRHRRTAAFRRRGFSLVEVMVATSIGVMLIVAILSTYTFLGRNLVRYSNYEDLTTMNRRALQFFASDVHTATGVSSFSSSQLTLVMPYVHPDYSVTTYTVTYTYDASAATLVRSVSGTAPPGVATNSITLLTGVANLSFDYLDMQGQSVTNSGFPFRIKQIVLSNYTLSAGKAILGTMSTLDSTSTRYVLRSDHLIPVQNGASY